MDFAPKMPSRRRGWGGAGYWTSRVPLWDSGVTALLNERPAMSMTGNRVLLVGGTSGLGLAVARAVAERGAQPIGPPGRQASVARAVSSLPAGAAGYTVDIASEDSLAQLVSTAGAVDHLLYTGGEALPLTHLG